MFSTKPPKVKLFAGRSTATKVMFTFSSGMFGAHAENWWFGLMVWGQLERRIHALDSSRAFAFASAKARLLKALSKGHFHHYPREGDKDIYPTHIFVSAPCGYGSKLNHQESDLDRRLNRPQGSISQGSI